MFFPAIEVVKRCHIDDLATVDNWSNTHLMPLSIEKSLVLHCGVHNLNFMHILLGKILQNRDTLRDLGVTKSALGNYYQHIAILIINALRLSGIILRAFYHRPVAIP